MTGKVSARGAEGASVTLYEDRVVIERSGIFARIRQGERVEVALAEVTGVHIQEPRMGVRGFIQLLVAGEAPTTWLGVNQHPRAVYFNSGDLQDFVRIKDAILAAKEPSRWKAPLGLEDALGVDGVGNPTEPPDAVGERLAEEIAAPSASARVILVVTANPRHDDGRADVLLHVDREERAIREALESTPHGRRFGLQTRPAESAQNLGHHLLETTPTILHLSGHGEVQGFVMEDELRRPVLVNPEALARFAQVKPIARNLRVLVINACLSLTQARYLSQYVDVVIGTSDLIQDQAAIAFARAFYNALGHGTSVGDAFDMGRAQVATTSPEQANILNLVVRPGIDASDCKPLMQAPAKG